MIDQRIYDKKYMISLGCNKEKREEILKKTDWLPENFSLKARCIALLKYTKETYPKCIVCDHPVAVLQSNELSVYCGGDCSRIHRNRLSSETYKKLNSYDWLCEQRITNKLSFEEIAKILGCSTGPVRAACKDLNIPKIKHNESVPLVLLKLQDKKWLEDIHCIQKKTLQEIADSIGSSKATVSRWLTYHNIEANPTNSYDRPHSRTSKEQQSLEEYLSTLIEIETNNRSLLNGKELDIIIPSKKIAIEYNGIYSHLYRPEETTESRIKGKKYHLNKTLDCQNVGYRLIHIFSDDWIYRTDICKSILSSALGFYQDRYQARKLEIRDVDKSTKKAFLNDNHIQGNDKSSMAFGLFEGDRLICLMTFCKSRYNKNYDWELSRFCGLKFTQCIGGFSRLLAHFKKHFQGSIISYADFARSNGDVYQKNNFRFIGLNQPSYHYVNLNKSIQRQHRSNFTKKKVNAPEGMTEYEFMRSQGYQKIFDCGTMVFINT